MDNKNKKAALFRIVTITILFVLCGLFGKSIFSIIHQTVKAEETQEANSDKPKGFYQGLMDRLAEIGGLSLSGTKTPQTDEAKDSPFNAGSSPAPPFVTDWTGKLDQNDTGQSGESASPSWLPAIPLLGNNSFVNTGAPQFISDQLEQNDSGQGQTEAPTASPLPPIPASGNLSSTQESLSQPPQFIPGWTEAWKERLNALYGDISQVKDETAKQQLTLDQKYKKNADKMLKQYTEGNQENMDKLTQETIEKSKKENGSEESPFYIEPNQFRKICDQNVYVLYSRVGGASGRDMRNPTNINEGKEATGENSVWRVPTCGELASCHCCINTCDDVVLIKKGKVWVPICLPNVGFGPMGCSPMCKVPIARGACAGFSGPSHGDQGDRDCMGRPAGCESSDGCQVIIRDPNYTQFEYTTTATSEAYTKSRRGDNHVTPGGKVRKLNPSNALPQGWIGQLDAGGGECCKCIQR